MDDVLIANDMPNHANAIIVTTIGAQKGAHRFAAYYGIRIQQVSHGPSYTFSYKNVTQSEVFRDFRCYFDSRVPVLRSKFRGQGQPKTVSELLNITARDTETTSVT